MAMAKTKKTEAGKPQVRKPALKSTASGNKDPKSKSRGSTLAAPAKAVMAQKAASKIRDEVIKKAKTAKENLQKEKHEQKKKVQVKAKETPKDATTKERKKERTEER